MTHPHQQPDRFVWLYRALLVAVLTIVLNDLRNARELVARTAVQLDAIDHRVQRIEQKLFP